MTWVALKLFLGGWLKRLLAALQAAGAWLAKDVWRIVSLALALLFIVQHFELVSFRHTAAKWQHQFTAEHAGRVADRKAYTDAQAAAAAANLAHVAADKATRERITANVSQDYEAQLVSLRADLARRLRQPISTAAQGASGSSGLPGVSQAPSGSDGAARVSIPAGLYVHGAELELKLEKLQQWVDKQVKVDPNKP